MSNGTNIVEARDGLLRKPFKRGDHVELAERLLMKLRLDGPIVYTEGQLWQYSNARHIYAPVEDAYLSRIVQEFADSTVRCGQKRRPLRIRSSDISGAIGCANARVADPTFFELAPPGLVFANGFVQVTSQAIQIKDNSSEHRARFSYPFAFDVSSTPTRFLRFLGEAFRDDEDASSKIALLQEFVGTAMLGLCTRYQKALALLGDGSNGKGVFFTVVEAAMPSGSVAAIPPQDLGQEFRRAMLACKLLNVVSELPETEIVDSESLKAVIAGDTITGRKIRQSPFSFRPVAGHLLAANRLPGTPDQSPGFWRRFLLVKFNRVFTESEQDPHLAEDIVRGELPEIVSWFLAGAQRVLMLDRYTLPKTSVEALADWKRLANQVLAFVEEVCDPLAPSDQDSLGTVPATVYARYRRWANANGHRPLAQNAFGERMRQLGHPARHKNKCRLYRLRLLGNEDG